VSDSSTKGKIVLVALTWLALLAIGVGIYRWIIVPKKAQEQQQASKQQADQTLAATSGTSRYRYELSLGLDNFSGYAVLRSEEFRKQLADRGIRIKNIDDGANYAKRASDLQNGTLQLAAFPADALLKQFSDKEYPAGFPDVDKLNRSEVRFVLVGDSPSETLARVVMQDFGLSNLSSTSIQSVASPDEILAKYKAATPQTDEVYVTWEPYVSQMLNNDQLHVLVDSSRFTGYIVDTLVVSRDFLLKNGPAVESILEAYFTALYAFRDDDAMVKLLLQDAKETKQELTEAQAKRLVQGIQWKNTQENLAHFGKRSGALVHIEDILGRISNVLVKSGAIDLPDSSTQFTKYFYDRPVESLLNKIFHPGLADEKIREETKLKELSEDQWGKLTTVGTLSVPELVFVRGSPNLTEASKRTLDDLAQKLQAWPQYYLIIRGNASQAGDTQANLKLASQRGDAAMKYLLGLGIPAQRMRVVTEGITGQTRVTFVVGQVPY